MLCRAVPEVLVEAAIVSHWTSGGEDEYFIFVYPDHAEYWTHFRKRYPYYKQVALRYGASAGSQYCPVFPTREKLIYWLSDVLNLSQGERNLLQLCEA
ncbi:hypothetical protein DRO59_00950 [Candidatus Bathyarchaeota archaeon]|nr:MAG: hypothetical protein DRO59_00950 [Candidatus Bathyarchaeota archaeon]